MEPQVLIKRLLALMQRLRRPWYPETRSRFGSKSFADRLNAGQAATLFGHRRVLSDQFDAKPARPSFWTPRARHCSGCAFVP
ncbi:MAG: hypothetical protein ACI9SE_004777, partial [Neolewinella sp.]